MVVLLAAASSAACIYRATEVRVVLGTNAPIERTLTVRATVYRTGAMAIEDPISTHTWLRGGAVGRAVLPGTFTVVPGSGNPRNLPTTLQIDASLEAGSPTEPPITFRRIVRFAFVPNTPMRLPIFLAVECGNPSAGCTTVDRAHCTVSVRCEEQNATCGDLGECVSRDVTVLPLDGGPMDGGPLDGGPMDASRSDTGVCTEGAPGCPLPDDGVPGPDGAPFDGGTDATLVDGGADAPLDTGGTVGDGSPCPGVCTPGQTGGSCGNCGTMTCDSTCQWMCAGSGCRPGATSGTCGNCGTRTCNSSCNWICAGTGACSPGATRVSGTCCSGTVCATPNNQTCSSSCAWVSSCGPCMPPC